MVSNRFFWVIYQQNLQLIINHPGKEFQLFQHYKSTYCAVLAAGGVHCTLSYKRHMMWIFLVIPWTTEKHLSLSSKNVIHRKKTHIQKQNSLFNFIIKIIIHFCIETSFILVWWVVCVHFDVDLDWICSMLPYAKRHLVAVFLKIFSWTEW